MTLTLLLPQSFIFSHKGIATQPGHVCPYFSYQEFYPLGKAFPGGHKRNNQLIPLFQESQTEILLFTVQ